MDRERGGGDAARGRALPVARRKSDPAAIEAEASLLRCAPQDETAAANGQEQRQMRVYLQMTINRVETRRAGQIAVLYAPSVPATARAVSAPCV